MRSPRSGLSPALFASALALLIPLGVATTGASVVTVSPGERERAVEAAGACPTFSWSAASGATGYELAVLRLDRGEEPELVYAREVAGSATSWSPSRSDCLESGGRYAWTIRALGADLREASADWAEARQFEIPGAPSDEEVAAAFATLERWRRARDGSRESGPIAGESLGAPPPARRAAARASGETSSASLATGVAAVRGENPDGSGSAFGLFGISHSPAGAGVVARNESAGADLILDGEANAATDTALRHDSLDRSSANAESFDFRNSGAGALTLRVDGVDVVTTATDADTLGALSCPDGQIAKRLSGSWQCATDDDTNATYTAGNQLQLTGGQFDVVEGPASGLDADTVDGLDSTALAPAAHGHFGASWTGNGAALTVENLGTTGNLSSLVSRTYTETGAAVYGQHGHLTAAGYGLYGVSDSSNGTGVRGGAPKLGVEGTAWATDGIGARGIAQPGTGANGAGLFGLSAATDGNGIIGFASAATGIGWGVYGTTNADLGTSLKGVSSHTSGANFGVHAESWSTAGTGVAGLATAASGATRGVSGESASASGGAGVYGKATSATGLNFGVVGEAPSPDSIGIWGLATSTTGNPWGVYGEVSSTATSVTVRSSGVYGLSKGTSGDGIGVAGGASSVAGVGVYGFNSAGGLAARFVGNAQVTGSLSKGGGSFKIDHPLDPEGKYLYHSFVESPDMMNLYNGNATLDENGEAWVVLPDWFEALNRDFRYQLTPLGSWSALWIEREIEGNRFLIRGGPRSRVSWQVTGVRHDPWAEAHRIPVEEEKPAPERGLYLHPEVRDLPADRGLDFVDPHASARTEGLRFTSLAPLAPAGHSKMPPLASRPTAVGEGDGPR